MQAYILSAALVAVAVCLWGSATAPVGRWAKEKVRRKRNYWRLKAMLRAEGLA